MSDEFGSKQIIRGTAITASLTMLSRVLGFLRDLIVAIVFGAGAYADAYFVAFRIPNLLRSLVAEGALSAAFVPIFTREAREGASSAQSTFRSVTTFLVITTIGLSVLGMIYAESIVQLIAPGFQAEQMNLCILLTRIMLPYILFVSLVAMTNGALTSLRSFGAAAAAQSIMNVVLICGGLLSALVEQRSGIIILSISVVFGGIAQVAYQIPALRRNQLRFSLGWRSDKPVIGELLKLMGPAVIGATIYQIMIFAMTIMASLLEQGSISWLFYADRLVQLPLGVFSVALGSVLLPALATNSAAKNTAAFSDNLVNSLRYSSFVLIPLSCLIFLTAQDVVALLFQRGAFDQRSAINTALAVQALAIGIWASSCQSLVARAFMAQRDNRTPTIIGCFSLLLTITLGLLLMGPISSINGSLLATILFEAQQILTNYIPVSLSLGFLGLAIASSSASLCSCVIICAILQRRDNHIDLSPFLRSSFSVLLAALAASVCSHLTPLTQISSLNIAIQATVFVIIYLSLLWGLRSLELKECMRLLLIYRNRS